MFSAAGAQVSAAGEAGLLHCPEWGWPPALPGVVWRCRKEPGLGTPTVTVLWALPSVVPTVLSQHTALQAL